MLLNVHYCLGYMNISITYRLDFFYLKKETDLFNATEDFYSAFPCWGIAKAPLTSMEIPTPALTSRMYWPKPSFNRNRIFLATSLYHKYSEYPLRTASYYKKHFQQLHPIESNRFGYFLLALYIANYKFLKTVFFFLIKIII